MSVVMTKKSIFSGATVFFSASPTGGLETMATYSMSRIMMAPRAPTRRSRAMPARLDRKTNTAMAPAMMPPIFGSMPSIALSPKPVPAMLPTLNTSPPTNTNAAITQPRPGRTVLPSSLARMPVTPSTRQTLSWIATSTRIEMRIAKAKDAPS